MIRLFPRLRNLALASLAAALAMPAVAQTAPAAPTGLTGWETATRRVVALQWDDPDDSTITKYRWRRAVQEGSFDSWADIFGQRCQHQIRNSANHKVRLDGACGTHRLGRC